LDFCRQHPFSTMTFYANAETPWARGLKSPRSDDDIFGGSTTAGETGGDFTEVSGNERVNIGLQGMPMMPFMQGMTMPSSAMPMPFHAMPSPCGSAMQMPLHAMPSPLAMPGSPHGAVAMSTGSLPMSPQGSQMYCVATAPDGTQMLVPMSSGPSAHAWSPQQLSLPLPPQPPQLPLLSAHCANQADSLDAQAAALTAYASKIKEEARKAKTQAAVAARRNRTSPISIDSKKRDIVPASMPSWADTTDKFEPETVADDVDFPNDVRTTLMFKNLPNNYNRSALVDMLDSAGFKGAYDLVYLPTDFAKRSGFGYAFVNFVSNDAGKRAKASFQGFDRWNVPSRKTCEIVWSGPVQGLQAHTERYRNSPVMHESVPDEFKPAVFVDGIRVPFPAATRRLRPPRVRRATGNNGFGIDIAAALGGEQMEQHKRVGHGRPRRAAA